MAVEIGAGHAVWKILALQNRHRLALRTCHSVLLHVQQDASVFIDHSIFVGTAERTSKPLEKVESCNVRTFA
jgi:hypothetical protein